MSDFQRQLTVLAVQIYGQKRYAVRVRVLPEACGARGCVCPDFRGIEKLIYCECRFPAQHLQK